MKNLIDKDSYTYKIPFGLESLFEMYGYKKFQMVKFESYDLYQKHRNFLSTESILTFTDAMGKLMALKPDVTVSIVNNTTAQETSKLYYIENVFRMDKGSKEYREIKQIGLEYIGGDSVYSEAEVVILALKSLQLIDENFVLNIGHLGFISNLLEEMEIKDSRRQVLLNAVKNKNLHEVRLLLEDVKNERARQNFIKIVSLSADFDKGLKELKQLAISKEQKDIVLELESLYNAVKICGFDKKVKIDMSVINDIDYYNGLILQGYIPTLAKALLTGGRYDNMMKRFDKPQRALGFAIYAGELERIFHTTNTYDADILLVYGNAKVDKVSKIVDEYINNGNKVIALKEETKEISAKKIVKLNSKGEVENA